MCEGSHQIEIPRLEASADSRIDRRVVSGVVELIQWYNFTEGGECECGHVLVEDLVATGRVSKRMNSR